MCVHFAFAFSVRGLQSWRATPWNTVQASPRSFGVRASSDGTVRCQGWARREIQHTANPSRT
ncbi:hypothetical protein CG740_16800 [Streptomyces sp. CB01201]|nr:hypothetical protein CG740_16800 [Streptomyces sp. CB01201]